MRNIPQDVRTFLLTQASVTKYVSTRIYHGSVPNAPGPWIWISRSGSENLECLDDATGQEPFKQFIDVECISENVGESQNIAAAVQSLFPRGGTFGSASIQRAYCNSQDDSYQSRNTGRSEMDHYAALSLEVVP